VKLKYCGVVCLVLFFASTVSLFAQMGMQMPAPRIQGVWAPVVGAGAAYAMETRGQGKQEIEYAIVGTEMVEGKTGHWLEFVVKEGREVSVVKQLYVVAGKEMVIKRMVVQSGDEEPMEFPLRMMQMGGPSQPSKADVREEAVRVGTETITVPGGTFSCEHWRAKDGSGEYWVSEKVAPFGVVKATTKDGTMTLVRVLTNAKTKIRGTPRKMEFPM
jgi:hypothetical protein